MNFDWITFLERNGIEYVTRGPNVSKGHIAIHCPLCGPSDPSQHLSVALNASGWRCWRNPLHRGRGAAGLVSIQLRCPKREAQRIVGENLTPLPSDDNFLATVHAGLGMTDEPTEDLSEPPPWPREFKPLAGATGPFADLFWSYLAVRGYSAGEAQWIAANYDLHYSVKGDYAYRLIIPVHDGQGNRVTWVGRAISNKKQLRYKALAGRPPGNWLLGLPLLWRAKQARVLLICEGAFDAMRVSALGSPNGIFGTCLFGLNVTEPQAAFLKQLAGRFRHLGCLLDADAQLRVPIIQARLGVNCPRLELPLGFEDPGELTMAGLAEVLVDLTVHSRMN